MKSISRKISFLSDGLLLKGVLHLPAKKHPPVVIGSHGLLSDSGSPKQIELARQCNAFGIAFFRFDHRGCVQSEGAFQEVTSLDARCNDLISAIKTVQAEDDLGNKLGLFGSSMGGAVCLSVAKAVKADAIVTFASPVRIDSIVKHSELPHDTTISSPLFDQIYLQFDIANRLSDIHHILIFHGDSDEVVHPSNAHEIYSNAGEPKKLIIQKGGDHRMTDKKQQDDFIHETASWFKKWLEKR